MEGARGRGSRSERRLHVSVPWWLFLLNQLLWLAVLLWSQL